MLWLGLMPLLLAEESPPQDDLDFLLQELEASTPSANTLFGLGTMANATQNSILESRLRYRISDRLEPGFEESHPGLHNYVEQVNRYYYKLNKAEAKWALSIQIDQVSLMQNKYILDDQTKYSWELYNNTIFSPIPDFLVVPEKVHFSKTLNNSKWELGDVGAVFGRGIALNIRPNKVVDIDTSLRGVKYIGNYGPAEIMMVTGLSNRQQISRDNPNLSINKDISHMVSGGQMMLYGLGPAQVGVHGMLATFGRNSDLGSSPLIRYEQDVDVVVTGADVELFGVGGVDWYLEGDLFQYLSDELSSNGEAPTGYTAYASASLYPGPFVVLFEGKISKDSERINSFTSIDNWEVATPPSLEYERMITEDSSAAVNSNDVIGGRLRVDYPIRPAVLTPYVSLSVLRDRDLEGLHFNVVPETIVHPITGVQYSEGGKVLLLNVGHRIDKRDGSEYGQDMLAHLDAELSFPLFGDEGFEINTSGWKFWWGENPGEHNDFITIQNALVWRHGEHWDFIFYQDYTTNTQLQSTGNITDTTYAAGEVKWKPNGDHTLRLLAGAYKAGIRCSGGQCRTLPGFEGIELAYSANF